MIAPAAHERPADLARELRLVATAVRRLIPDRRDPERFHMEKSSAAHRIAVLARKIEREAR